MIGVNISYIHIYLHKTEKEEIKQKKRGGKEIDSPNSSVANSILLVHVSNICRFTPLKCGINYEAKEISIVFRKKKSKT